MKFSHYNNMLEINSNVNVVYNSFSGHILFVGKDALSNIDDIDENVANNMRSAGMLIDDDVDEISLLRQHRHNAVYDDRSFLLIINPTLNCNFDCWYCYESHQKESKMTEFTLNNIRKYISGLFERYDHVTISFFGGEPMLGYKQVVSPLMKYSAKQASIQNKQVDFAFTTNGYLFTDNIINELQKFNISHLQITLDGDRCDHDSTRTPKGAKSFDRIILNITKLIAANIDVVLRLNVTGKTITGAYNLPQYFKDLPSESKKHLNVSIHQVWQDRDAKINIHQPILELYESFYNAGITPNPPNNDRISSPCYGDSMHSAVINYNGDTYNCTAVDFPNEQRDGYLNDNGTITSENHSLDTVHNYRQTNDICDKCRIISLCNGGCFKTIWHSINKPFQCQYPDDESKDKLVREVVEEKIFFGQLLNSPERRQS